MSRNNNLALQTNAFISLQNEFKLVVNANVPNKNSRYVYLSASKHLLLFCERIGVTDFVAIPFEAWKHTLTHSLSSYERHIRNHFIPFLVEKLESRVPFHLQPRFAPDRPEPIQRPRRRVVRRPVPPVPVAVPVVVPVVIAEPIPEPEPEPVQPIPEPVPEPVVQNARKVRTRASCPHCNKDMLKKNLVRHSRICVQLNH